jgi:hypothetical protein
VNFCKIRGVDILQSGADIIVLSANPSLLAGSGISGFIHKAAGNWIFNWIFKYLLFYSLLRNAIILKTKFGK